MDFFESKLFAKLDVLKLALPDHARVFESIGFGIKDTLTDKDVQHGKHYQALLQDGTRYYGFHHTDNGTTSYIKLTVERVDKTDIPEDATLTTYGFSR